MSHHRQFAQTRFCAIARAVSLVFALASFPALGSDSAPIGRVKTVSGEAWVGVRGEPVRAEVGTPVPAGAVIRTGPAGKIGVTLRDNTLMSFGPDTEISIDDYRFDPEADDYALDASMTRGTLNFVSGLISRMRPEAQRLRTPNGTIGVRGTQFFVKLEGAPR